MENKTTLLHNGNYEKRPDDDLFDTSGEEDDLLDLDLSQSDSGGLFDVSDEDFNADLSIGKVHQVDGGSGDPNVTYLDNSSFLTDDSDMDLDLGLGTELTVDSDGFMDLESLVGEKSSEISPEMARRYINEILTSAGEISEKIDSLTGIINSSAGENMMKFFKSKKKALSNGYEREMPFANFLSENIALVRKISDERSFKELFLTYAEREKIFNDVPMPIEYIDECEDYKDIQHYYKDIMMMNIDDIYGAKDDTEMRRLSVINSEIHELVSKYSLQPNLKAISKITKTTSLGVDSYRIYSEFNGEQFTVVEESEQVPVKLIKVSNSYGNVATYLIPVPIIAKHEDTEYCFVIPYFDYVDLSAIVKKESRETLAKNSIRMSDATYRLLETNDKSAIVLETAESKSLGISALDSKRPEFRDNIQIYKNRFLSNSETFAISERLLFDLEPYDLIRSAVISSFRGSANYYYRLKMSVLKDLANCGTVLEAYDLKLKHYYYRNLLVSLNKAKDIVWQLDHEYGGRFGFGVSNIIESASNICSITCSEILDTENLYSESNKETLDKAISYCEFILDESLLQTEETVSGILDNYREIFNYGEAYKSNTKINSDDFGILKHVFTDEVLTTLVSKISELYIDNLCTNLIYERFLGSNLKAGFRSIQQFCSMPLIASEQSKGLLTAISQLLPGISKTSATSYASKVVNFWSVTSSKEFERSIDELRKASASFSKKHLPDFVNACHKIDIAVLESSGLFSERYIVRLREALLKIKTSYQPMTELQKLKFYFSELGFTDEELAEYIETQTAVSEVRPFNRVEYYLVERKPGDTFSDYVRTLKSDKQYKELNGFKFFTSNMWMRAIFSVEIVSCITKNNMVNVKLGFIKRIQYSYIISSKLEGNPVLAVYPMRTIVSALISKLNPYTFAGGLPRYSEELQSVSCSAPFVESKTALCNYVKYSTLNTDIPDGLVLTTLDGVQCFSDRDTNYMTVATRQDVLANLSSVIKFSGDKEECLVDRFGFYLNFNEEGNILCDMLEEITENSVDGVVSIISSALDLLIDLELGNINFFKLLSSLATTANSEGCLKYGIKDILLSKCKSNVAVHIMKQF